MPVRCEGLTGRRAGGQKVRQPAGGLCLRLTALDSRAGAGDLGVSMVRAVEALRALPQGVFTNPPTFLAAMVDALRRAIGGNSGQLYAMARMRAARELPASLGVAVVLRWAAGSRGWLAECGASNGSAGLGVEVGR